MAAMTTNTSPVRNLAFASFHKWLPGAPVENANELVQRSRNAAGISKICFLRHGNTGKVQKNGQDRERVLTDLGKEQATQAGVSFGEGLGPFYPVTLVSPVSRTVETAKLFLEASNAAADSTTLKPADALYDGTMQPEGSRLFRKLGYAPLSDYLDNNNDNADKQAARVVLGEYARTAVSELLQVIPAESTVETTRTAAVAQQDSNYTLLFVGHAVYLPAAALAVASLAGCDQPSIDLLLSRSTQEAEGFLIDLQDSTATYLERN